MDSNRLTKRFDLVVELTDLLGVMSCCKKDAREGILGTLHPVGVPVRIRQM